MAHPGPFAAKRMRPDDKETNNSGNTLLHIAAQRNPQALLKHLEKYKKRMNVQNNSGKTPLVVAIEKRNERSINILLDAGANIFIADNEGKDALDWFFYDEFFNIGPLPMKFLEKVESHYLNDKEAIAKKLYDVKYPLLYVMFLQKFEKFEIIEKMLQRGRHVDERELLKNSTALHAATQVQYVKGVEFLLNHNADPNAMDMRHRTPLYFLYENKNVKPSNGHLEILKMLIDGDANTFTSIDNTVLINQAEYVLRNGNSEAIKILMQSRDFDLAKADELGNTALHYLARNVNPNAFEVLRDKHFNVNVQNSYKDTPLLIAASIGASRNIELLLLKGADVHSLDQFGHSPLYQCIDQLHTINIRSCLCEEEVDHYMESVQLLLEYDDDLQFQVNPPYGLGTILDLLKFRLNPGEDNDVHKLLIAHIALQTSLGKPLFKDIRNKIYSFPRFANYYEFCQQQLAMEFYETKTLLDLFSESDIMFRKYARDPQFAKNLENFNETRASDFYYYNAILRKRYRRHKAATLICTIMQVEYSRFPHIADQIISYLDDPDLRNFLQVLL